MTLSELNMSLQGIMSTTDMELQETAQKVDDLSNMLARSEISESEYKELMADIESENFINKEIKDLEGKAALAQIFDWAKTAASFLP